MFKKPGGEPAGFFCGCTSSTYLNSVSSHRCPTTIIESWRRAAPAPWPTSVNYQKPRSRWARYFCVVHIVSQSVLNFRLRGIPHSIEIVPIRQAAHPQRIKNSLKLDFESVLGYASSLREGRHRNHSGSNKMIHLY